MIPLSSVPIEVRKEYALSLLALDVLEPEEALVVTIAPGDVLVPDLDWTEPARVTHWQATCADCGKACWTRGGTPRCIGCFNKALGEGRKRKEGGYCPRGHSWAAPNIYTRPNGERYCRVCSREDRRRYRERKRETA